MTDNSTYDLIPSVEAMAELVSRITAEQQAAAATALATQRVPAPSPPTSAYPKPLLLSSSAPAEPAEPTPPGEEPSPAATAPSATATVPSVTSTVASTSATAAVAASGVAAVAVPVTAAQKPITQAPTKSAK